MREVHLRRVLLVEAGLLHVADDADDLAARGRQAVRPPPADHDAPAERVFVGKNRRTAVSLSTTTERAPAVSPLSMPRPRTSGMPMVSKIRRRGDAHLQAGLLREGNGRTALDLERQRERQAR